LNRVEKLNKAIEILHIQHGMSAREIQTYLKDRNLYLDLQLVTEVVLGLNYSPVSVPRKSKIQLRCERLNPILRQIVQVHQKYRCPWRYLALLLEHTGVLMPGSGQRPTSKNVQKYLRKHDLHQRVGLCREVGLTYLDYCAKLEQEIQQLLDYSGWVREGN